MNEIWNPWHGCKKYSEGCQNCYVYRRDESIGKDTSVVEKTKSFGDPLRKKRDGGFYLTGHVYACMTSDFFIDEADGWRQEAWAMIRARGDLHFSIITKRIDRVEACLPPDWGSGYDNVTLGCTMESQKQADRRLPIFKELPLKKRFVICEPLLTKIDFQGALGPWAGSVTVGGESGKDARVCDYDWVLFIREQCIKSGLPFRFKQTGARFKKEGRVYLIERKFQEIQAQKADIDWNP